ncbi:Transposon Ty3-I Gag-Pol polyprotein [Vitis vinifera]|uniref:Transposon Ty3-I Gag-Pol polyprotein n=1 Tax=Vitis vinifera TaxID=29760 RepID=A0A438CRC5_VITVI|nr:Transposon Ty3-I Gag-Pol polyprotein [Vitis vinifera]
MLRRIQAPHSDDPQTPDVQYILRGGRVVRQPPPAAAARPVEGTSASQEEVRAEDDEILRQLQSTQARISIWSLLASSSTHRDALTRALSQIRVDTTTTPEGLIHMMTAGRATCIVFSDDDLPPEGSDHTRPLYISVGCSGRRVPSVLLDNGSALNVCPLATAIALGYAPSDFGPSTQTVLRIPTSFNLLLGRPWIHRAGAIPSSLHQKVKFIHDAWEHSGARYYAEHVLSTRHGVGSTSAWTERVHSHPDHDVPFGLGFIPTEADYLYMARLRKERVRARLTHTPFYYPLRPYTRSLADYFVRASEPHAPSDGIVGGLSTTQEAELQRLVQQLRLRDGAPGPSTSVLIAPSSPDRTSLMTLSWAHFTIRSFRGVFHRDLEESQTAPALEIAEDAIVFDDLIDSHVGIVEGASDFVDPPLSFDVLSGFVSRSDIVSDVSSMDLSIFEYLPVSCDIDLSAPSSPTSQIFDIDDEIAQHDSDDDSSSVSDSDPVDQRVSPAVGDTEIVDFGTTDQPRELRIGSDLSTDERQPHPVAQSIFGQVETIAPSLELAGERGDSEATQCGFLSVVEYPEWLANVVPVPKKDGKVRVCVDFRDLNKASPKDDFPLPHIDMLVDSTAGHSMLSFMDGFSGYSQILMAPEDMEKTSFITEWGTYCYRVMPFGLKNAGATYQRAATTLFHDMMHRDVEFRLRLNPKKCTFGVTSGKLLGYMVSERGIEVDPDKIRAILDMPAPRTERRKSQPTVWDDQCQRAFERIREYLLSPPVLAPPTPGRPLLLYYQFRRGFGCMLAQLDDSGKDRAIYYLNPLVGRLMRWLVLLTEFDIHYVTQKSIRGSIVADHLASLPVSDARAIDDDFPDEDVAA